MPNSREWSRQIHERSCSHYVARAHVKFTRIFARTALRRARGHAEFTRMVTPNSRGWLCQIHESCYVKFMREVARSI